MRPRHRLPVLFCMALLVVPLLGMTVGAQRASTPNARLATAGEGLIEVVGHVGGTLGAITVHAGYAYAGIGPEFAALDLDDPMSPRRTGYLMTNGASDIVAREGYAYVAEAPLRYDDEEGQWIGGGLRILDLGDPSAPRTLYFLELEGFPTDIAIQGEHAYVTTGTQGLRVIHVADPGAPVDVGNYREELESVKAVAVEGTLAYVLIEGVGPDARAGLQILDIAEPAQPAPLGFVDLPTGMTVRVAVQGAYAYITANAAGLRVVDVSNPDEPFEAGYYDTPGIANHLVVRENLAYVGDSSAMRVIDISDPEQLHETAAYETTTGPLAIAGEYLYLGTHPFGLEVLDLSGEASPSPVGFYSFPLAPVDVTLEAERAYVADGFDGLRVVDISTPARPEEGGFYDTPGQTWEIAIAGAYAYVADGSAGMRVIDIIDPAGLVEAGYYDPPGPSQSEGIALQDNHAYLADWLEENGLSAIEISSPTTLEQVGFLDTPGAAQQVVVQGEYAYVADDQEGLTVVRISDPTSLQVVGRLDTPGRAEGIAVQGQYVYLAEGDLRVIDVSEPTAPVEVGFFDIPGNAWDVVVSGALAYVADNQPGQGLYILDISDPHQPDVAGFFPIPMGGGHGVDVAHGRIAVAAGGAGLYLLRYSPPPTAFPHHLFLPALVW